MITIPKAPIYTRQVTSINAPSTKMQASGDANAYGAGVASQIGNLANQVVNRADEMQAEDDRNSVIKAKSALDTQLNSTLYDEKAGLMNQKGENALDLTNKFNTDYDNLVKNTSATLKNKRQQDVFNQYSMGQKDNYLRSVSSHQAKERQIYTQDNADVAITSAQNLAIVNPNDKLVFNNSMATINKTIDSVYGHKGKTVTDSLKQKALSSIRSEQVTSMLSQGQGIAARDFLVMYKADIDPKQYDNLYTGAESKAAVQESKAVADDVINRYGVGNERAAMKYLKDTYGDNPGYDKFSSTVQARFVDERRFKNNEETDYRKSLAQQIDAAGTSEEAFNLISSSNLPLTTKNQLNNAIKAKYKVLAGTPSKEQKLWSQYEAKGLYKDQAMKDEYDQLVTNGDDINPKQQTKYNAAVERLNRYESFSNGVAYNQPNKDELKQHENDMWTAISKLAESNIPQADIIAKIKQIAPKYGFDPEYFINGAEWDKVGKVKGQYGG